MRGSRKITSLARALAPFANRTAGSVVDRIISAAAGAGTFVDANVIHLSGSTILLRHPGAARLAEYPATTEGLQAALAAAVAGDTVLLPAGTPTLPVAAGGTYTVGSEISNGYLAGNSADVTEITGLSVGTLYAIEGYNGPWYAVAGPGAPQYTINVFLTDPPGTTIGTGEIFPGGTIVVYDTPPDWGLHCEVTADGLNVRLYFTASSTSLYLRIGDSTVGDNTGGINWRLSNASITGDTSLLEIPEGVEVVGLGKNTILDGDLVNNGILTNCTVTGTVTGTGKLRMVYNASGEQITDLVVPAHNHDALYAPIVHNHDADYAPLIHDHIASDINSADATDGQVLTADGLGGATWETPAGGGSITVEEVDGTPTVANVTKIKVTNGTLTDEGAGVVTIITGGGAGGGDMNNPMTTAGDIIIGGASGTPVRLGIGTEGQVLTIVSGVPTWADAPTGSGGEAFATIDPEIQQTLTETFSDSGVPTT